MEKKSSRISRRGFLKKGAVAGLGATTVAGFEAREAQAQTPVRWDREVDVVIAGHSHSRLDIRVSNPGVHLPAEVGPRSHGGVSAPQDAVSISGPAGRLPSARVNLSHAEGPMTYLCKELKPATRRTR